MSLVKKNTDLKVSAMNEMGDPIAVNVLHYEMRSGQHWELSYPLAK